MVQLIYTTQRGEEASIQLLGKTGFTARIVYLEPASAGVEERLWGDLAQISIPILTQTGDHTVYGKPDQPVIIIVQSLLPRQSQTNEHKSSLLEASLLVHRGRREWIIVAERTTRLFVDDQPIPFMKIIKEAMKIRLGELNLTFREVERTKANLETVHGRACPFCRDPLQIGEEVIACPSCGTVQHAECWDEYGGRCSGPPGCRYGVKKV